jgi:hypothetical protein
VADRERAHATGLSQRAATGAIATSSTAPAIIVTRSPLAKPARYASWSPAASPPPRSRSLPRRRSGALRYLERDRPRPMGELTTALVCECSNLTGIVDRLESRGLVERRSSPTDRRVRVL